MIDTLITGLDVKQGHRGICLLWMLGCYLEMGFKTANNWRVSYEYHEYHAMDKFSFWILECDSVTLM